MQTFLLIIHIIVSIMLISLILMQHGKGADMGASFGSGASQTLFGSQGSGSFMMRFTASLAAVFFITSLSLGYLGTKQHKDPLAELPASGTPGINTQAPKEAKPAELPG